MRFINPSATTDSHKTLYMTSPKALEQATKPNLNKTLGELIQDGENITVTDEALADTALALTVNFEP